MESRHEDILSEIKLGDPQSALATTRQCNIIPDLLKVPMKDEVSLILYIYIYICLLFPAQPQFFSFSTETEID